ncbi:hypothetical protein GCM10008956_31360 [Deinococcus arenae]|uniref:Uncharacterized protein n=1 Tax=Deinococcus arenae TaxID=1452751 RepID=A0A8H9GSG9_9DEIO|nr:hypothetical protein [Deinococcus arenae]GGM53045.1 hypothetical protein GCM10008956_31360 [Deinococcus arenae]
MNGEYAVDDLILLDLHYSGMLRGALAEDVCARLDSDASFQRLAEQYLTDWANLLEVLEPTGLVPDGAEDRLIVKLRAAHH